MRIRNWGALIIILSFSTFLQGAAAFGGPGVNLVFDGEKLALEDPVPVDNGAVLLPAQILVEKLGLKATFLEKENAVILRGGKAAILLTTGSCTAFIDAKPVRLQAPPRVADSGIFLPLRFVCESAGASVSWDQETRTAYVQSPAAGGRPRMEVITSDPLGIDHLKARPLPGGGLGLSLTAFMYGNLSNINLKNDPVHSAEVLSKFPYLILNDPGILRPAEKRITDAIKGKVKIFGYVEMGGTPLSEMAALKAAVDRIAAQGWYGVFLDQFGHDYNETRARQNELVEYAHGKGLKCFANGWFIDDVLGSHTDPLFNPNGEDTRLGQGDWILLESFLMDGSGYRPDIADLMEKYIKARKYSESLKVKVACLTYGLTASGREWAGDHAAISYLAALAFGFDGWWSVDAIEDERFLHGPDPGMDVGARLEAKIEKVSPHWYLAETDKYLIIFSTAKYPPPTFIAYPREAGTPAP